MKRFFLSVALLLSSSMAIAEIYKWVDKEGTMHFSDQPQPGATTVTVPSQALREKAPTEASGDNVSAGDSAMTAMPSESANQDTDTPAKHGYRALSIQDPADQSPVRDNNGTIVITVNLEPDLAADDKLQVLLDGKPYGDTQTEIPLKITGVDRGEHTLAVEILDKTGKQLKISRTITIFLHKAAIHR